MPQAPVEWVAMRADFSLQLELAVGQRVAEGFQWGPHNGNTRILVSIFLLRIFLGFPVCGRHFNPSG